MSLLPLLYWFPWVRDSRRAGLSLSISHGLPRQQCGRWGCGLIWGWTGSGCVSRLRCLLAEFSSFQSVGLKAYFLAGCEWEATHLQFLDNFLTRDLPLCQMGLPMVTTCFMEVSKGGNREDMLDSLTQCNHGVASCQLCCILLARNKSQVPFPHKNRDNPMVWAPGGVREPAFESSHPRV